jgi:plasmid maintenance system antidote protein VapI
MRLMAQQKVTRGTIAVARAVDARGLTWKAAAEVADLDATHLGEVLKGKEPGRETIAKLRSAFGTDANLWLDDASAEDLDEHERLMHSMRERAMTKTSRAAKDAASEAS